MLSSYRSIYTVALLLLSLLSGPGHAQDIQLTVEQGKLNLSQFKGQVIYLDFWASWCGPCRKSFPWLNKIHKEYAQQGVKVIAVNLDSDPKDAESFLKKNPANFLIAYDPDGSVAKQLKVSGMPSSYLINRQGQIISSHVGFLEKNIPDLENEISKLVKQKVAYKEH